MLKKKKKSRSWVFFEKPGLAAIRPLAPSSAAPSTWGARSPPRAHPRGGSPSPCFRFVRGGGTIRPLQGPQTLLKIASGARVCAFAVRETVTTKRNTAAGSGNLDRPATAAGRRCLPCAHNVRVSSALGAHGSSSPGGQGPLCHCEAGALRLRGVHDGPSVTELPAADA